MTDMAQTSLFAEMREEERQSRLDAEAKKRKRYLASRLSMEARRRAVAVLVKRYRSDYDELYGIEKAALLEDDRYKLADPE